MKGLTHDDLKGYKKAFPKFKEWYERGWNFSIDGFLRESLEGQTGYFMAFFKEMGLGMTVATHDPTESYIVSESQDIHGDLIADGETPNVIKATFAHIDKIIPTKGAT